MKGRKEGKDEEINGEGNRPFEGVKKRSEVQSVRTGAVLNSCVSETKQKRGEKYKEQEKIVRDIQ